MRKAWTISRVTPQVFRHYDIGEVEALRDRLANARERARGTKSVTAIRAQS